MEGRKIRGRFPIHWHTREFKHLLTLTVIRDAIKVISHWQASQHTCRQWWLCTVTFSLSSEVQCSTQWGHQLQMMSVLALYLHTVSHWGPTTKLLPRTIGYVESALGWSQWPESKIQSQERGRQWLQGNCGTIPLKRECFLMSVTALEKLVYARTYKTPHHSQEKKKDLKSSAANFS